MKSSSSLVGRALIALGLMVGFYLLAVAVAGALFFVPYAEWTYAGQLHIKLALACILAGLLVLWSILPRIDRFVPPGPLLKRERHPRLFAEIESIASATGQRMPSEVYLVGDVNAWVSQRGGALGIGGRRVMGIGLPLLGVLTRSQMRAVLAHEFGHFHGGDTSLGPLVYRTRSAIERAVVGLSDRDGSATLLQAPFRWYGQLFLRVTHAISRRQEYTADALAARTVGAGPLISGLQSISAAARAFPSYWRSECAPVLGSGFLPPLAEGFAEFLRADEVAGPLKAAQEADHVRPASPYDTHPSLPERIAALASLPPGGVQGDDPRAITLLEDVPGEERAWVSTISSPDTAARLVSIPWSAVGNEVYVGHWRKVIQANKENLRGIRLGGLDNALADLEALSRRFVSPSGDPPADPCHFALQVCTAALGLALLERGARLDAPPGRPITLMLENESIDPHAIISGLAEKKLGGEEWLAMCTHHGVNEIDLAQLAENPRGCCNA